MIPYLVIKTWNSYLAVFFDLWMKGLPNCCFVHRRLWKQPQTHGRKLMSCNQKAYRSGCTISTNQKKTKPHHHWFVSRGGHANGDQKISLCPPRSYRWSIRPCIASLSFGFIFLWLGNCEKPRNEKLPFNDGDGNIGEKNEPRDWVQAVVEDMRHVV